MTLNVSEGDYASFAVLKSVAEHLRIAGITKVIFEDSWYEDTPWELAEKGPGAISDVTGAYDFFCVLDGVMFGWFLTVSAWYDDAKGYVLPVASLTRAAERAQGPAREAVFATIRELFDEAKHEEERARERMNDAVNEQAALLEILNSK